MRKLLTSRRSSSSSRSCSRCFGPSGRFPRLVGSGGVTAAVVSVCLTTQRQTVSCPARMENCCSDSCCGEREDREEGQPSPPHPQEEDLHLPRSSPVISRRHRALYWQGGGTSTPAAASSGHDQQSLAASVQAGQQGLTGGHGGRGPDGCGAPLTAARHRTATVLDVSAHVLQSSVELDEENAHFIVVDMVLEVLEAVKWTLTSSTDSPRNRRDKLQNKTESVLSTDSGFEDCPADATPPPRDPLSSAERLAQRLVLHFRRSWLPPGRPGRGRLSLRSSLQEMPGSGGVAAAAASSSSLHEEIRQRTRMRGSLNWAPPRLQIIFTLQPLHRRSEVVAAQHFLCAGCGTEVEARFIKKLRYCEYLGRYFCDCCHGGSEAVIPARVLCCWDFSRRPVSDFSRQLLDSLWPQPVFDLSCVGRKLLGSVKELSRFKELREQLVDIKKLLRTCRFSRRVLAEIEHLPPHLTELPQLFSMDDLWRVKKGQLVLQVRALLDMAIFHVETCELCLARGFICEFCRDKDVIFPFQRHICTQCPVCRACFHTHCFREQKCPKCTRIQSRKKHP